MAEMIARFKPGQNVPVFATAAILAGRFVKKAGAKTTHGDYPATHCGAGEWAFGVAEQDSAPTSYAATATDRRVNVVRAGAIARVTAGAAITVDAEVQSNAAGKAVTQTTGVALGRAMVAAAADGDVIEVELYGAPSSGSPNTGNQYVEGTPQADIADVVAPVALTSAQEATADATDAASTQALANSLKANYNTLQVDVAAIRTKQGTHITSHNLILDVLDEYGMTL